jgi:hypothetical protein
VPAAGTSLVLVVSTLTTLLTSLTSSLPSLVSQAVVAIVTGIVAGGGEEPLVLASLLPDPELAQRRLNTQVAPRAPAPLRAQVRLEPLPAWASYQFRLDDALARHLAALRTSPAHSGLLALLRFWLAPFHPFLPIAISRRGVADHPLLIDTEPTDAASSNDAVARHSPSAPAWLALSAALTTWLAHQGVVTAERRQQPSVPRAKGLNP